MAGAGNSIDAPIVSKSAAEQVVTAPVLTPGDPPDRERHWYSAENIEEVAQSFLPNGQVDAMHAGGEVGHPTESWVAKQDLSFDGRTVPKGSWMVSAKVTDDSVWNKVESGDLTGVSVFGPVRAVYDDDGDELDIGEIARPVGTHGGAGAQPAAANSFGGGGPSMEIPPAPVGSKWRVEFESADFVSIVDDPAVQAASFVVAKSTGSGADNGDSLIMEDDVEERFDELKTVVEKSADAAEAAQESAEQAQETAETALDEADGGGGGGGEPDELTAEDVGDIVEDKMSEAMDDIEAGTAGGDDLGDLDDDTVETLVEQGVIEEGDLEDVPTGAEKRFATIEKKLDQIADGTPGRQGFGTQLDGVGEDGEESGSGLVGSDDRAAAIKRAGSAGGSGGDGE